MDELRETDPSAREDVNSEILQDEADRIIEFAEQIIVAPEEQLSTKYLDRYNYQGKIQVFDLSSNFQHNAILSIQKDSTRAEESEFTISFSHAKSWNIPKPEDDVDKVFEPNITQQQVVYTLVEGKPPKKTTTKTYKDQSEPVVYHEEIRAGDLELVGSALQQTLLELNKNNSEHK